MNFNVKNEEDRQESEEGMYLWIEIYMSVID